MDRSSSQGMMPGLHRSSVTPGSIQPEFWTTMDSLYTATDPAHQHPHPTQQQLQPQQQAQQQHPSQQHHHQQQQQQQQQQTSSLGIGWDHPIFAQQQQQPQQQRNQLPQHQEHNHGIYSSSTPQSWQQQNSMQHHNQQQPLLASASQGYGVPTQYHQVHRYPPGQVTFDSRSVAATENPTYQQYAFPRNFYSSQQVSIPNGFSQSNSPQVPRSQVAQQDPYQSGTHGTTIASYGISAGFPEETSINFANSYAEPTTNVAEDPTINPQMLNPAQQTSNQHTSLQHPYLYLNTPDFGRPDDAKIFNFYENDLQVPSAMGQTTGNNQGILGQTAFERTFQMNGQPVLAPNLQAKPAEPQKKKARTKTVSKKSTAMTKRSSSSESDTSDDSELEIEMPEEPSPIPATRPTEPEAATAYDTLRAVWSPRNRRPNADKVKNALVAFKDVVKSVRDAWKESSQAMKMAENRDENDKAIQHKKEVVLQRRLMDVVVSTALEKGHPTIVEKLGEHPMALAAMYSFLLDRHQASDVDGAFTVNILKLLARFVTVDEDVLQKTNIAKLLPRFVKKGGPMVKELSQKILDNAAASTKRKEGTKTAPKESSRNKSPALEPTASDGPRADLVGSKRVRDGETNGQPASKRMVVTSNIKPSVKTSSSTTNGTVKRAQDAGQENKPAAAATRPKANIVAPKPTSLFGSLASASKRPGTSNAERAAAAAAAKTSPPAEKKETQAPPPRPAFSFGDIMADLDKQKESKAAEPAEDRPPETEEERQKRLRKEARRKLRVTWKPDASLTEVRLFTHDPEEELGPGDHSQGEAGDIKGEGSVLKLHRDLDDMEDEDDGGIREEQLSDYSEPSEIDKEEMPSDERSRNYIKRGGTQEPSSQEKQAQERREATTLMVFYTSAADIPPSPKEPPPPSAEEPATEVTTFGELPDHIKVRQERYYSAINPKPVPAAQPVAQNNQVDISNLLKIIQSASQQQATPPPPPQPAPQPPMSDLERTISMFRQQQQPQQPPAQMPQIPQFPPATQPPATSGIDFQKLLAVMNAQKQMQPAPPVPQAQPTQPAMAPNLAAFFSQFANPNQQAGSSQPPGQHFEDPERKRMRETNDSDGASDDRFDYAKRSKFGAPNKKHPKAGLVPCRYWREGKCLKGDNCTFRHDPLN